MDSTEEGKSSWSAMDGAQQARCKEMLDQILAMATKMASDLKAFNADLKACNSAFRTAPPAIVDDSDGSGHEVDATTDTGYNFVPSNADLSEPIPSPTSAPPHDADTVFESGVTELSYTCDPPVSSNSGSATSLPLPFIPDLSMGAGITYDSAEQAPASVLKSLVHCRMGCIGSLVGDLCTSRGIPFAHGAGRRENRASLEADIAATIDSLAEQAIAPTPALRFLIRPYDPGARFVGGDCGGVYLDIKEAEHARVDSFAMGLLSRSTRTWPADLRTGVGTMLDAVLSPSAKDESSSTWPHAGSFHGASCDYLGLASPTNTTSNLVTAASASPTSSPIFTSSLEVTLTIQFASTKDLQAMHANCSISGLKHTVRAAVSALTSLQLLKSTSTSMSSREVVLTVSISTVKQQQTSPAMSLMLRFHSDTCVPVMESTQDTLLASSSSTSLQCVQCSYDTQQLFEVIMSEFLVFPSATRGATWVLYHAAELRPMLCLPFSRRRWGELLKPPMLVEILGCQVEDSFIKIRPTPWPPFSYQVEVESKEHWTEIRCVSLDVGLCCSKENTAWYYYLQFVLELVLLKSPCCADQKGMHSVPNAWLFVLWECDDSEKSVQASLLLKSPWPPPTQDASSGIDHWLVHWLSIECSSGAGLLLPQPWSPSALQFHKCIFVLDHTIHWKNDSGAVQVPFQKLFEQKPPWPPPAWICSFEAKLSVDTDRNYCYLGPELYTSTWEDANQILHKLSSIKQPVLYIVNKEWKLAGNNFTDDDANTLGNLSLVSMLYDHDKEVSLGTNTAKSRLKEGSVSHIQFWNDVSLTLTTSDLHMLWDSGGLLHNCQAMDLTLMIHLQERLGGKPCFKEESMSGTHWIWAGPTSRLEKDVGCSTGLGPSRRHGRRSRTAGSNTRAGESERASKDQNLETAGCGLRLAAARVIPFPLFFLLHLAIHVPRTI